jgi:hypothetical protein
MRLLAPAEVARWAALSLKSRSDDRSSHRTVAHKQASVDEALQLSRHSSGSYAILNVREDIVDDAVPNPESVP